jgi:hypothetical protein
VVDEGRLMKANHIIGKAGAVQQHAGDEMRVMVQDYVVVLDDGLIVVMAAGEGKTNGASLPWLVQVLPRMGSPLEGNNPWWSCPHDGVYNGSARIFNVSKVDPARWLYLASNWRGELLGKYEVTQWPKRKWADRMMRAVMKAIGEPRLKVRIAYAGVRVGGWCSFKGRR